MAEFLLTTWRPCSSIIGCIAWLLALAVPLLWWRVRALAGPAGARAHAAAALLLAMLAVQIALGIATLRAGRAAAARRAHQAGAVLLFAAALNVAHALR